LLRLSAVGLTRPQVLVARFRRDPNGPENGHWVSSDSHLWTLRSQLMKTLFSRFAKDESGATAIEYGLIAAGISVAIIAVVNGLGTKLNSTFSSISSQLK
jgi:pilus assembly protein Flp/PilA